MKKYLKKVSYFLIIPLIGFLLIEWNVRSIANSYSYKMDQFKIVKSSIDQLILGNSHAYYGLNPSFLSKSSFNLANLSQSLDIDFALLKENIEELDSLNTVILPISSFSLAFHLTESEESWRKYDYYFYSGLARDQLSIPSFDIRNMSLVLAKGFKPNVDILKNYWRKGSLINCSDNGWGNNYEGTILSTDEKLVKGTVERHASFMGSSSRNEVVLNQIIELLKEKGIQLVLIQLPVTGDYFNYLNVDQLGILNNYLLEKQNANSHVVYLNWIQKNGFTNDFFYDPDHLNHSGAEKVSKLLADFLKQ